MKRTTKEEVMKAALIWKAEHPYEDYIEKEVEVKLPNGVVVPLGTRLRTLKSNPKYLTKEEKEFFDTLEIRKKLYPTKNEMKQAAEIWKKDHPNETYVDKESKVTLLNGKIIEFGKGLRNIKSQINRLSENDKIFWSFYDISESPQLSEEEWREAAEIWKSEHEDAKYIPCDAEVTISSGKKVALGTRISNMRRGQVKLTDEQKEFWSSNYDALERIRICITEEEWREAARLWKEDHPKAKYIARNAQVTISSNKKVSLGTRIVYMKQHPENLTEEQKTFWNSNYNVFENVRPTEEEWKEAVEIWKRAHPNEEHIKQKEEVTISSGKKLLLGRKIAYIKKNFDKLSEQEQLFWGGRRIINTKN